MKTLYWLLLRITAVTADIAMAVIIPRVSAPTPKTDMRSMLPTMNAIFLLSFEVTNTIRATTIRFIIIPSQERSILFDENPAPKLGMLTFFGM